MQIKLSWSGFEHGALRSPQHPSSAYTGAWGVAEVARLLRDEVKDELEHAERIISRMIAFGAVPNASQLRPVRIGNSLIELLQHNYDFERERVQFYEQATQYCARNADHDNRLLSESLLNEEKTHADDLARWIEELKSISVEENLNRTTF
jgi:bacterioferritin